MATRISVNSPVEVGSWNPIIYKVFIHLYIQTVVGLGISEPSKVLQPIQLNNITQWFHIFHLNSAPYAFHYSYHFLGCFCGFVPTKKATPGFPGFKGWQSVKKEAQHLATDYDNRHSRGRSRSIVSYINDIVMDEWDIYIYIYTYILTGLKVCKVNTESVLH